MTHTHADLDSGSVHDLREAFAPYMAEAGDCACPVCRAVGDQRLEVAGQSLVRDAVAYWAAVSEQLRVLATGEHHRVEWAEHVATLPPALAGANPSYDLGRDGGREGIGVGVGPRVLADGRRKHLELYCCAGGSSKGYARAGFAVYGVDLDPQPSYPYPFHQGDALTALRTLLAGGALAFLHPTGAIEGWRLRDFASIGASPPCQTHTALTKANRRRPGWTDTHVDLIPATRQLLEQTGLPYVIENVQGSGLRRDLTLCGEMFGLGVIRHRYFELGGWSMAQRPHVPHRGRVAGWRHGHHYDGPYVAVYGDGGGKGSVAQWQAAMGIDWTDDRRELAEAIPPAYAQHIGTALLAHVQADLDCGAVSA